MDGVNVYTTDHPMMSEPFRLSRRMQRTLIGLGLAYPTYLLKIGGPLWPLEGQGQVPLNFIPARGRIFCLLPTAPVWRIPHVRGRYADYMDWWYSDVNNPDRKTGSDFLEL